MQKPAGMSRSDYHNMVAIVRQFIGLNDIRINLLEDGIWGSRYERTDEGFSNITISVSLGKNPKTYYVIESCHTRDCDGRYSNYNEYVVGKAGKRKRYYMSRDWKTNKPVGKFGIMVAWKILASGKPRSRDYTAEAAGY